MANWHYYNSKGEKVGPISVSALKALTQQGLITRDTVIENHTGRTAKAGEVNGLTFPETKTAPDTIDETGNTALQLSEVTSKYPMTSTDVNAKDAHGFTRLHHAAVANDVESIAVLAKAGAHIDAKSNTGATPLLLAISKNTVDAADVIIKNGADLNVRSDSDVSPLILCVQGNKTAILTLLIEAGADVNAKSGAPSLSPLMNAVLSPNAKAEIVAVLIKAGANVNEQDGGVSILHSAAAFCNAEIVTMLINAGADTAALTPIGLTPHEMAIERNNPEAIAVLANAKNAKNTGAPNPFTLSMSMGQAAPTGPNPFETSFPAMQSPETAFMQRCPEIDLSVIPEARRAEFMQRYELFRPQMEGNNVMVYLTENEIASDPCLRNQMIERLQHVNSNGVASIYCRVHNGGQPLYNIILGNYSHAFVSSYQSSGWSAAGGILAFAGSLMIAIFAGIGLGSWLADSEG